MGPRRASAPSTRALAVAAVLAFGIALAVAACGGSAKHRRGHDTTPPRSATPAGLGFPDLATKNTTRIATSDPVSVAAAAALAVFPSAAPGTHPTAVVLAPTNDWEAAIAAASLMASPFRAPLLLSTPTTLSRVTASALNLLAPSGAPSLGGVQVIRIGAAPNPATAVANPNKLRTVELNGAHPPAIAAAIDAYEAKRRGAYATDVMIASTGAPAYAMPAAGYAAESGDPVLFVTAHGIPAATRTALRAHHHPHLFVLGPVSAIPNSVLAELRRYGPVARISGSDPAASSVAFTEYRDPACAYGQPCVHVPGSFGWAIRSPGHGYVLIDASTPLDAAAASALSSSGSYGPQLLIDDPNTLPESVLNYFLNFATPGYTGEGPTAAVYNHAWLIGGTSQISVAVQAEIDGLLEAVPQR